MRAAIEADVAIQIADTTLAATIADTVRNSGTILGDVRLGPGADVIVNSGTMNGRTLLGEGNDQYLGASGRHDGSVEGGPGNDQLTAGLHSIKKAGFFPVHFLPTSKRHSLAEIMHDT